MNREQVKSLLPVMTAFGEGKEIEFDRQGDGSWSMLTYADLMFCYPADRYRVKSVPTYLEKHKASGFKVGDKVRVIRKLNPGEHFDWVGGWHLDMDNWVWSDTEKSKNRVWEIRRDADKNGFVLSKPNNTGRLFNFPYFVLEKYVEPVIEYRPFASAEEFIPYLNRFLVRKGPLRTEYYAVSMVNNDCAYIKDFIRLEWSMMFNDWTFEDGSPCGIKEVK